jgi:phospholipid/cholesterol/gamma-HCH transport system substrate-binding protein
MMETHSQKFKARLGFFVAAGLALFIAGIFYIGRQKHLFNPVFRISTTFKNISGLQVGNNVRFSGINVGTVDNISIKNDTTVKVDLLVDKDVQPFIKKTSIVRIGSEGIIGDKIVAISQGTFDGDPVQEDQYLASTEPVETDAIVANLKITGENAAFLSNQLADILYKINNGNGTLARLIYDTTIAQNIGQTIVNLKKSAKGFDENMEAAKHNFLFRGYFRNKKKREEERDKKDPKQKNK